MTALEDQRAQTLDVSRPETPWPHLLIALASITFAVFTAFVLTRPLPWVLDFCLHDDSFYYLTPAENIAHGLGSTFDGVTRTNGYQPLWCAIAVLLFKTGINRITVIYALIAVQSVAFAGGMVLMYRLLLRQRFHPAAAGAAIGIVYVGIAPVLGWNLLETGIVFLCSAAALLALDRFATTQQSGPLMLGLILGTAALARTDHMILIAVASPWFLVITLRSAAPPSARVTKLVLFAIPIVLLIGGYLLFNVVTTGHLEPVSGRVKSSGHFAIARLFTDLLPTSPRNIWKLGLFTALGILVRDLWSKKLSGLGIYSIAALGMYSFYRATFAREQSENFWYFVPMYHLACVGLACVLNFAASWAIGRVSPRATVAAMTLLLAIFLAYRVVTLRKYAHYPQTERSIAYDYAIKMRNIRKPGETVAAWDSGILGYFGGPVTNLDGLVNSTEYYERYLSKGRTPQYIRESRFDYLVVYAPDVQNKTGRAIPVVEDGEYETMESGSMYILHRRN